MTAYPHSPQRASHVVDVLIETAVGQRNAPRREHRQSIGNTPGLMFKQATDGGSLVHGRFIQHGFSYAELRLLLRPGAEDLDDGPKLLFDVAKVHRVSLPRLEP